MDVEFETSCLTSAHNTHRDHVCACNAYPKYTAAWLHWVLQQRFQIHFGHYVHDHCMVYSRSRVLAPAEGAMVFNYNARHSNGVDLPLANAIYNHFTGVQFIGFLYFFFGQFPSTGNCAIKTVCMGGTQCRNIQSSLGKGNSIYRMGMGNAATV